MESLGTHNGTVVVNLASVRGAYHKTSTLGCHSLSLNSFSNTPPADGFFFFGSISCPQFGSIVLVLVFSVPALRNSLSFL
jgi:hypothetical protein